MKRTTSTTKPLIFFILIVISQPTFVMASLPHYNADKPISWNSGASAARILFHPKRRLLRNYYPAALLCSSTMAYLLSSMRGGSSMSSASSKLNKHQYRRLHTTIIHRHGDRTPITPLKDEDYWKTTLPTSETLENLARGTIIQRPEIVASKHTAKGRGPFGKLTQLGLDQMIAVGSQLKELLVEDDLSPQDIRVVSTDFPRTIQSVQAVLHGLLPYGLDPTEIVIDCRHTNWMIPDPQPRNHPDQVILEQELIHRPHMIQKEVEMHPLAVKSTKALLPYLADDAFGINMGIDNAQEDDGGEKVLPWAQLAEITKCLQVRDKLPTDISIPEQQALSDHLAWRWFQSLRDKRLAQLAMGKFAREIVKDMTLAKHKLTIFSCHDSSLIGLICAFGLENPSEWPEYGSFLKVDLLESQSNNKVVQFSLNGERLHWHDGQAEIPLEMLQQYIDGADI